MNYIFKKNKNLLSEKNRIVSCLEEGYEKYKF
jgi:hypothetical protein